MKTKTTNLKTTTCKLSVPACLSPTNQEIKVGEKIDYIREFFYNGEHWLRLPNGESVPSVFFE